MENEGVGHYQFKLRCRVCRLHFVVLTWDSEWAANHAAHCPECGQTNVFVYCAQPSPQCIFEVVPGGSKPLGISEK